MSDNQKAASILRQYAGELYQGHTIGGRWDDSSAHIKAEHDELLALADRLALGSTQERGEAVAYLYHDAPSIGQIDGRLHSVTFALAADRLPNYRNETPLYANPSADDARVAELERDLRIERKRAEHAEKVATVNYADLRQANASIAALREREGRMREALEDLLHLTESERPDWSHPEQHAARAALAAEKGEK